MIALRDIYVNCRRYEFSHGGEPRGFGSWAFEILPGEIMWAHQAHYRAAKRLALQKAQVLGSYEIIVLP